MGSGIQVEMDGRGHFVALVVDLDDAADGIEDRVADVFEDSGPTFVRTMRRIVPKDTHALEESLGYSVQRKGPVMRLGVTGHVINPKSGQPTTAYASYVHDGTWKMHPRPFLDMAFYKHTTPQGKFMRGLRRAGVGNIGRSTGGLR